MAEESRGNVERLRTAGIVTTDALPDLYAEVLEELDEQQVESLILLMARLVEAEEQYKREAGEQARPLVQCFVPL
jgi:hypothetical protein